MLSAYQPPRGRRKPAGSVPQPAHAGRSPFRFRRPRRPAAGAIVGNHPTPRADRHGTSRRVTRRSFLAASAAGLAAPLVLTPRRPRRPRRPGPNGRINLGFIGVGMMGRGHLGGFLGNRDVQVVAVCDVAPRPAARTPSRRVAPRLRRRAQGRHVPRLRGVQRLPRAAGPHGHRRRRHRHARTTGTPSRRSWRPGRSKDIYCEKPLSLTHRRGAGDGRRAARDNNVVFQTGSQQRTEFDGHFRKAVEYVRSGRIGRVQDGAHRRRRPGPAVRPAGRGDARRAPTGTCGTARRPSAAYNHVLCPKRHPQPLPAPGATTRSTPAAAWPTWARTTSTSPSGPSTWTAAARPRSIPPETRRHRPAVRLRQRRRDVPRRPERLHVRGDRRHASTSTAAASARRPRRSCRQPLGERDFHLPNVGNSHRQNWLDCIRSRRRPVADVEIGARSAQVCQLGNIGYRLRRDAALGPGARGVRRRRRGEPPAQPREPHPVGPDSIV